MRRIQYFKSSKIKEEQINRIKEIAFQRYASPIYEYLFTQIVNIDNYAELCLFDKNKTYLILGEDWFLLFEKSDENIHFLEWIALDIPDIKFIQTLEMMATFKKIFTHYHNYTFSADMRHDSSFKFYLNLLEKGYFKELSNDIFYDNCDGLAPSRLNRIHQHYGGFDYFFDSKEAEKHPEYFKYILHEISFNLTDQFKQKYMTKSRKKKKVQHTLK